MTETENAIIVVDVQNDFCPGGALAVKGGDEVVESLNKILDLGRTRGWLITASRDWHPTDTTHFDIWPVHCVQNTKGAEFHPNLNLKGATIFSKGMGNENNGYSSFEGVDNEGKGLQELFLNIRRVHVGGLATDYCVKETVLEAIRIGYEVYLMTDAIKAVNLKEEDGNNAIEEMVNAGARLITVAALLNSVTLSDGFKISR